MRLRRLGWFCVMLGSMLLVIGVATAATPDGSGHDGVGWREVALAACGLLTSVVGAYVAGQTQRIGALERNRQQDMANHQALRELVLKDYHTGDEVQHMLAPVINHLGQLTRDLSETKQHVAAVHARLDSYGVSSVRRNHHD